MTLPTSAMSSAVEQSHCGTSVFRYSRSVLCPIISLRGAPYIKSMLRPTPMSPLFYLLVVTMPASLIRQATRSDPTKSPLTMISKPISILIPGSHRRTIMKDLGGPVGGSGLRRIREYWSTRLEWGLRGKAINRSAMPLGHMSICSELMAT